jgi:hypothetical protein
MGSKAIGIDAKWCDMLGRRKPLCVGVILSLAACSAFAQEYTPGTVVNYNNGSMPQAERVTIVAATELFGKRRWTIRTADGRVFDTYPEYLTTINAATAKPSLAPKPTQRAPTVSRQQAPHTPQRSACSGASALPASESSPRDLALAALIRHYTQTERANSYSMYSQAQDVGVRLLNMKGPQAHQPVVASSEMAAGSPVYRFEASYRVCFVDQHDMHRRGSTRAFQYADQTFELFRAKDGQWRVERMTQAAPVEIRVNSF